jgi:hypothetical protein
LHSFDALRRIILKIKHGRRKKKKRSVSVVIFDTVLFLFFFLSPVQSRENKRKKKKKKQFYKPESDVVLIFPMHLASRSTEGIRLLVTRARAKMCSISIRPRFLDAPALDKLTLEIVRSICKGTGKIIPAVGLRSEG